MERNLFSSPEDLARFASITSGGHASVLYWADGVAFLYSPLPSLTETAAKAMVQDGRVYWAFLGYAIMNNYQSVIETREKIIIPLINMSSNPTFKRVADWLKNQCYPEDKL